MKLKLPDLIEDADTKYHYNLGRGKRNLKLRNLSKAIQWFRRAMAWAMDHQQDFHVRTLIRMAESARMRK